MIKKLLKYSGQLLEIWMLKGAGGENSKVRSTAEKAYIREYGNHHKQTVERNMNVKGIAGEGLEGNLELNDGNCRRGESCYVVAET